MADNQERTRKVRAATFDLEGTIVDLENLHHASHLRAAADHGIHLSLEQAVVRLPHFIGGPDEQVASEIASLPGTPVDPQSILRAKQRYFQSEFSRLEQVSLRLGFLPFLEWLTHRGIAVAVGTVSPRAFATALLDRTGTSSYFPSIRLVAREDVSHPKPAPDVYIKTAQLCAVSCQEQLVFEDSPIGVRAARLAQSRVVAIPVVQNDILRERLTLEGAQGIFTTWDSPELRMRVEEMISCSS